MFLCWYNDVRSYIMKTYSRGGQEVNRVVQMVNPPAQRATCRGWLWPGCPASFLNLAGLEIQMGIWRSLPTRSAVWNGQSLWTCESIRTSSENYESGSTWENEVWITCCSVPWPLGGGSQTKQNRKECRYRVSSKCWRHPWYAWFFSSKNRMKYLMIHLSI